MVHLSLLLALSVAPAPSTAITQDSAARRLEQRIDRFLQPNVASNNFTGVILVRHRGGVALNKGYGMANYELGVVN
nr:hypothetical protein [Gemmatimonadales bacterium]